MDQTIKLDCSWLYMPIKHRSRIREVDMVNHQFSQSSTQRLGQRTQSTKWGLRWNHMFKQVQGKWKYLDLMIGERIMEDLENQGMLVDIININIPRGTQPEEHMHIQGQKVVQVCLL